MEECCCRPASNHAWEVRQADKESTSDYTVFSQRPLSGVLKMHICKMPRHMPHSLLHKIGPPLRRNSNPLRLPPPMPIPPPAYSPLAHQLRHAAGMLPAAKVRSGDGEEVDRCHLGEEPAGEQLAYRIACNEAAETAGNVMFSGWGMDASRPLTTLAFTSRTSSSTAANVLF